MQQKNVARRHWSTPQIKSNGEGGEETPQQRCHTRYKGRLHIAAPTDQFNARQAGRARYKRTRMHIYTARVVTGPAHVCTHVHTDGRTDGRTMNARGRERWRHKGALADCATVDHHRHHHAQRRAAHALPHRRFDSARKRTSRSAVYTIETTPLVVAITAGRRGHRGTTGAPIDTTRTRATMGVPAQ